MKSICIGNNTKHPIDSAQVAKIRQDFKLFVNQKTPLKVCLEHSKDQSVNITFFQGEGQSQIIDKYSLRHDSSGAVRFFQETCGREFECLFRTEPIERTLDFYQENQWINNIIQGIHSLFDHKIKLDFLPIIPQLRIPQVPLAPKANRPSKAKREVPSENIEIS